MEVRYLGIYGSSEAQHQAPGIFKQTHADDISSTSEAGVVSK